jgi:hypothetical protein
MSRSACSFNCLIRSLSKLRSIRVRALDTLSSVLE